MHLPTIKKKSQLPFYAVWNPSILTTENNSICCSFYNCIAIITTIVNGIIFGNSNAGKSIAIRERSLANGCYAWNLLYSYVT